MTVPVWTRLASRIVGRGVGLACALGVAALALVVAGALSAGADAEDAHGGDGAPLAGVSGLAPAGPGRFLVVHDWKQDEDGPRLVLYTLADEEDERPPRQRALPVADWRHPDGRSRDLEGVCALPGRPGEFLLAESQARSGRFGRIFHVAFEPADAPVRARVERVLALPAPNDPSEDGANFEGLACAAGAGEGEGEGSLLVILGERGETEAHPAGFLRWGRWRPGAERIAWASGRVALDPRQFRTPWPFSKDLRPIADLFADEDGVLWGAAAEDRGETGPFRSTVGVLGTVRPEAEPPVRLAPAAPAWTIDGYKVEGLARAADGDALVIGTEDELLGGSVRPLPER